ncbi:MAG: helix-turn-helix transcriptional regulator [Polyangiaceae bacterium]|nr:helix-turn-helix transcriptional regulator [Polyangiaceae bacterium]
MALGSNRKVSVSKTGCAVETALGLIGGRWKGVVIYWLLKEKRRFGELRRLLPSCTQRMLTLQLRELEADGLVKRTVFPEVPPHVEYELTPFGRSLEPVVIGLRDWGEQYKRRIERAQVAGESARLRAKAG